MAMTNEKRSVMTDASWDKLKNGDVVAVRVGNDMQSGYIGEVNTKSQNNDAVTFKTGPTLYARDYIGWPTVAELAAYRAQKAQSSGKASATWGFDEATTQETDMDKQMTKSGECGLVARTVDLVQADTVAALWRTSAREFLASAKTPIKMVIEKTGMPKGVAGMVLSQLDTPHGEAGFAWVLGMAITATPTLNRDEKVMRVAKELRILGLEWFTSSIASAVLDPIRENLLETVKNLSL